MLSMKRRALILAGLILILAGCEFQLEQQVYSTLTIAPPENPYQSTTKTPAPRTPTAAPPTAEPLIPTPTPFIHILKADETLYGLALQYKVSLDRLVSANPGLDSRNLAVGTEVIIPLAEEELLPPTSTPYPLLQADPVCHPSADGGLWCYTLIKNNQNIALENISFALNIFNSDQELIKSQIAFPPLDILLPDQNTAVGALISELEDDQSLVSATLLTAYPSDQQNPSVRIADYSLEYSQENKIAHVSGAFEILPGEYNGDQVWVAGIGLSQGKPAAVRKWISGEGLEAEKLYPFEFLLYSLGPALDQVLIFGELH